MTAPLQLTMDGNSTGTPCVGGNDGQDTSTLTCDLGTLEPGTNATIDVTVWAGEWSGERDVLYSVTSDGVEPSPDTHPNTVTVATTIVADPISIPTVEITSPGVATSLTDLDQIEYAASASDDIDGDISDQIQWSYRPDGDPNASSVALNAGASGTFGPLAAGAYTLTASVTNSTGHTATDSLALTISLAPPADYDLGVIVTNAPTVIPTGAGEITSFPVTVHNFGTNGSVPAILNISTTGDISGTLNLGGNVPTEQSMAIYSLAPGPEIDALQALARPLTTVLDRLGNAKTSTYLASAEWPEVVRNSAVALASMVRRGGCI